MMAILRLAAICGLILAVTSATTLPRDHHHQNATTIDNGHANGTVDNKQVKPVLPSARQARADLSSLARFITPDNINQMKSFLSGYGSYSSLGNVLSFNVGNVVLITLLAGLVLLIAPTILGLFGLGAVGTNLGRSLGITNEKGHVVDTERVYRAMDTFFQEYNIDARTCLQRFSCAASRKSSTAIRGGNPSYLDQALNYLLESSYVTVVLDKTSMLTAVNYGKSGGDCEIEYGKCPFSWEKVSNYLPVLPSIKLSSPFFGGAAPSGNESSSSTTSTAASPPNSKLPQAAASANQ